MTDKGRHIIALIVFNLLAVTVLALISEVLIRLTCPSITTQGTSAGLLTSGVFDNIYGMRPSAMGSTNGMQAKINSLGCRETGIPFHHARKNWLLLGDSVTFGVGVCDDSTFAARLQQRLTGWNVLNCGVIGYSYHEYHKIAAYWLSDSDLHPRIDHLTLCFCLNDVYHSVSDIDQPGGGLRHLFGDFLRWLRAHSRLYIFLKSKCFDRSARYYRFDEQFYSVQNPEFGSCLEALSAIRQLAVDRGVPFEIVLLPYEYQLRPAYQSDQTPQALLGEQLSRGGIPYRDCLAYFRNSRLKPQSLYLYGDGIHFSSQGHRLMSDYMHETIIPYLEQGSTP